MNIFKTKKFILLTIIFILTTTISFGLLQLFSSKNVQNSEVYAFTNDGTDVDFSSVATVSMDSGWSQSSDGVYEATVDYSSLNIPFLGTQYYAKSATLTISLTLEEQSKLKMGIVLTSGTLETSPTIPVGSETTIILEAGENTLTFKCSSTTTPAKGVAKVTILDLSPNTQGIDGTSITEGLGTTDSPYIINEQDDFAVINQALNAVYSLENDITLTGNFTPIGTMSSAFSGTFLGNGHTISNMTISGGNYRGLFAKTNGGTIKDLTLNDVDIKNISPINETTSSGYGGMVIGYAENGTAVQNVNVSGTVLAEASYIGGLVGYANGHSAVKAKNCKVYGLISTTESNAGGLSGAGGTFENCVVYARIEGKQIVGGFTGGYKEGIANEDKTSGVDFGSFTNCFVAGDVAILGEQKNNYPYWGVINGYGAYCKYTLSNAGQRLTVNYQSSSEVEEIKIFNSNSNPDGIAVTPTSSVSGFTFTQDITLTQTYAGGVFNATDLLSETSVTGITGNYGGFTIRFKMADGTYKYVSTLNKEESKFQSVFDINLDNLTSYVDNFNSIEIDTSKGTKSFVDDSIKVWGTAKIASANDFEHLSWVINGAIPTTFANGLYYNARSVTTISVELQADIDLTTLNPTNHNFYGLGKTEMYPYRGSIYGNGHSLTVDMNFPNAYLLGIICVSTEQENGIVIENLTVNGTIAGRYRVGIVGMHDNYARETSLTFNNVTNNANISATSQVGAFLGEAQGNGAQIMGIGTKETAKIYLNNCINNGNITATAGDAGGLIGVLDLREDTYAVATLNNCANNGKVTASRFAGGFIANIANTVTVSGINTNSGIVTSSSNNANFYVGYYRAGSFSSTDGLKTIYKINLGVAGETWNVTGSGTALDASSYTADEFGVISVGLINAPTFSGTLSVSVPYLKTAVTIKPTNSNTDSFYSDQTTIDQYKKTMATFVEVPTKIELSNTNVYDILSSKDSWKVQAIVTNNNQTTETITLTTNLDETALNSNQLVFANVCFEHSKYNVEEFSKYLYRITDDVENYVLNATNLINKTSGTNEEFKTLGLETKTGYEALINELNSYSSENLTRFENFINNKNVSFDIMNPYYKNIAQSIDESALQNLSLNYGVYETTKTITFTMLSGDVISKNITYTFEKCDISNLIATASTSGISFKVGEVVTCQYNKDISITINPIDVKVEFENAEYVFDNTSKSIVATITVLEGDSVTYSLTYNGEENAINANTYEVCLYSLSGTDAIFYNIPESYTKGTLKISPILLSLEVEHNKKFTYNQNAQATEFYLVKQNTSAYELNAKDYSVVYSNDNYNSSECPINAGTYTATITLNNNFNFSSANTFTFEIQQKKLETVTFETELIYNGSEPSFEFNFADLISGDESNVEYKIFNNLGAESDAKNVGTYTLQIISVGNDNYYVEDLIKDFVVNKAEITLKVGNQTSNYGDEFTLNQENYEIEGTVFAGDNLKVKLSTTATRLSNVATYPITASTDNENYDVEIVNGTYEITKRVASIDYGTLTFTYVSQDLYSEIKPILTNVIEEDLNSFVFELFQNDILSTEFKNAGTYTLKLVENEVLSNYSIEKTQETYIINPKDITLKAKDLEKNFNQTISDADFGVESVVLAGLDSLEDIVEIEFEVYEENQILTELSGLNVGEYAIKLKLTRKTLYENYNLTTVDGTLQIFERVTYLVAQNIEKFYDEKAVEFNAKLFGADNEEITDANITYTFTLNGEEVSEVKNVGSYQVNVKATAGENNKTASATYSIVIKTNVITIALNNAEITYNGQNYVPSFSYVMNVSTDITNLLTYSVLDSNKQATTAKNAGNYYVEFNMANGNYSLQKSLFDVKITPINLTLEIEDRTVVYGDEFDIQTSNYSTSGTILDGEQLDLVFEVVDYSELAKQYVLTATNNNKNYNVTIIDAIFEVAKRELEISYEGESELTFNEKGYNNVLNAKISNALSEEVYSIYYLNANNQQIQSIVDAGSYFLVVALIDTQNYKFSSSEETLLSRTITISKKTLELDIKIESKIYDGTEISLNGVYFENSPVSTDLYSIEFKKNNLSTTQPKDVGEYTVKIVEKIAKNYQFINNEKSFEICSRELTISTIETTYSYSRLAIKPELTLNNVVVDDDVKLNLEYVGADSTFKQVGEYTIKLKGITGANSANYHLNADETITYFIVPTKVEVQVKNTSFVFTNEQITKENLNINFISDIEVLEGDYFLSSLPTFAGNYEINITSTNSGIEFNLSSFNVEIEKAEIEGIRLDNKTVNYNNKAHSLAVDKTTLSNGIDLDVEYSLNSFVDAGIYSITATLTNENYITKELSATLEIKPVELKVEVSKTSTFTYNSTNQGIEILGLEELWYSQLISYIYEGENYSSMQKPINAGQYSLKITPINSNNIKILNVENEFVINTKAVTIQSLQPQTTTYNAQNQEYAVSYVGVINGEDVQVNVLYNNKQTLPKNAGTYQISFAGLSGKDSHNYHIANNLATSSFVINQYEISVRAENKTSVYGEEELELTYVSDALLGDDVFSGSLVREQNNNVGSHFINLGTLTAGENYKINFTKAIYYITQRELSYFDFQKEFTYNGTSQIPSVTFTNVVAGDVGVAKINTIGNTTNAGTYTLQFAIINSNYKLPEISSFEITINKLDMSEKIICLITTEKDYSGTNFEPMVMIDGDLDYALTYLINGTTVDEMIDSGTYQVEVNLTTQNYVGSKTFEFKINKIDYNESILNSIVVENSSNSFSLLGLENATLSVDNVNFNSQINNLESKTTYNLYVKVEESKNFKTTTFLLGEFSTCASALELNEQINEIISEEINSNEINSIKELLKDCNNLSESEQAILNDENYLNLKNQYEEYFNQISEEIEEVKISSDIVEFGEAIKIKKLSIAVSMLGFGLVLTKKRKNKDEFKN